MTARTARRTSAPSSLRVVAPFLLVACVVLLLVGVVLALLERARATEEAVGTARDLTALYATDVVGDALDDAALVPGPARDRLDALVHEHVLGADVVRVKVWDASGTIVYSDRRELLGQRFPLPEPIDNLAVRDPGPELVRRARAAGVPVTTCADAGLFGKSRLLRNCAE